MASVRDSAFLLNATKPYNAQYNQQYPNYRPTYRYEHREWVHTITIIAILPRHRSVPSVHWGKAHLIVVIVPDSIPLGQQTSPKHPTVGLLWQDHHHTVVSNGQEVLLRGQAQLLGVTRH